MERFIGVKQINAKPMTWAEYNDFRGWKLPADENGEDAGFLVEYLDGGKANTPGYAGYVSWSPADVFERAYRPCAAMTFGLAVEASEKGIPVRRDGWNGKGLQVVLRGNGASEVKSFYIVYPNGDWFPWHPSPTDILAEDWQIVE